MRIICKDTEGFEDQLTPRKIYKIEKIGVNGFLVADDKGQERWFGFCHFDIGTSLS